MDHNKNKKLICESVIESCNKKDPRPFISVEVAGEPMEALLDSGASISCLGHNALDWLNKMGIHWTRSNMSVQTADGSPQCVLGHFTITVKYKSISKMFRIFIVPGLSQNLYLGIDFWKEFGIVPMSVECISSEVQIESPDGNQHKLTDDQKSRLMSVVETFPSFENEGLGKTPLHKHQIDTGNCLPIKQRHYAISPAIQKSVDEEINRMIQLGVIEESQSSWSSPIVLVKKSNGKSRLCLDSRELNKVTKTDAYPLPKIDGHLGRLANTRYISSIDLKDAFWQIELEDDAKEKTAFSIPGRPLYHFRVMPFGLCNAAQSMCRLMDKVIPHEYHDRVFVYIDDLLVVSADFESHVKLLELVSNRLRSANLTINVDKSKFCLREIKYLGFVIGDGCIRTDIEKIKAIVDFPIPKTVRHVRRFVGMTGWYRRFLKDYATVAAPLTDLYSLTDSKFRWNPIAQEAFEKLKVAMSTAPILSHPDFSKHFFIQCDASTYGVGSVLFQLSDDGKESPISYFSQKLNKAQKNYSVTELECLAAVLSVKKFRPYVEGMSFTVITDHASLKWLMNQNDLNGRLARWSLKLQGYNFSIEHRKGKMMVVPDALSRAHADEIDVSDNESFVLDMNSNSFQSEKYKQLHDTVVNNPGRFPDIKTDDTRLYKRTKFRGDEIVEGSLWKLWIPPDLINNIIVQAHDPPMSAHQGFDKTLNRIKRFYYWPKMAIDVRDYVSKCIVCKETKAPNVVLRPPMGNQFVSERPFQMLYIDLLGPYPRSKLGNTFILIILDHFSKFVILKPLRNATTAEIIKCLEKDVFHLFGVPETILSDNGKQFVSKVMSDLCSTYGIKQLFTAIYSPQANASERVNRSILAAIRAYIKTDHRSWDEKITQIASALRNTVHVSTGYSAYYIVFGRNMVTHASEYNLLRKLNAIGTDINITNPDDFSQLIADSVRRNLIKAHEKGVKTYNTRCKDVKFGPGQEVFRRNFTQSDFTKCYNAKLAKKFVKCRVRSKLGNSRYELEDMSGKLIGTYHAKDIRQ